MKVAVVGIGRWGQVLLRKLKEQAEVKYECDSHTDLGPVLADSEIEAVFIATPTETHFDIALRALEAGKHVFLEKPGTTNSKDLTRLIEKAKTENLKLAIGYEFVHHPAVQKLKGLLSGKTIKGLRFEWFKWGTFDHEAIAHLLCHDVSVASFLDLQLEPSSCKKVAVISDSDILETEFKNGVKSFINRVSPIKKKTLTVLLDKGGYIWSNNELFEIKDKTLEKVEVADHTPVQAEVKDFLSSIKDSREPLVNGDFALKVYEIIEQVSALR